MIAAGAGLLPPALASAWIPVRTSWPNTVIALVVALSVGLAATAGGRGSSFVGALLGTSAFDLFDTAPYGRLDITRAADVATTLTLLVAGLIIGELSLRLRVYQAMARRRGADFAVMSAAAGLMALGENAAMVVSALAGDIQAQLDLVDCEFTYGPPTGERPCVTRNGEVVRPSSPFPLGPAAELDLPVWLGTEVAGRYRLVLGPEEPDRDRLLVAVGLAEQAGAALAGARPDDPERRPFLRPVR